MSVVVVVPRDLYESLLSELTVLKVRGAERDTFQGAARVLAALEVAVEQADVANTDAMSLLVGRELLPVVAHGLHKVGRGTASTATSGSRRGRAATRAERKADQLAGRVLEEARRSVVDVLAGVDSPPRVIT